MNAVTVYKVSWSDACGRQHLDVRTSDIAEYLANAAREAGRTLVMVTPVLRFGGAA